MASTYSYRLLLKSSWGIAIDLTADTIPLTEYKGDGVATQIEKGLWFAYNTGGIAGAETLFYFQLGLKLVAKQLQARIKLDEPLVVSVLDLDYNPTDFQYEGFACAIAGWTAQEFGFIFSPPPVYFDKAKNRYIFTFPDANDKRIQF